MQYTGTLVPWGASVTNLGRKATGVRTGSQRGDFSYQLKGKISFYFPFT